MASVEETSRNVENMSRVPVNDGVNPSHSPLCVYVNNERGVRIQKAELFSSGCRCTIFPEPKKEVAPVPIRPDMAGFYEGMRQVMENCAEIFREVAQEMKNAADQFATLTVTAAHADEDGQEHTTEASLRAKYGVSESITFESNERYMSWTCGYCHNGWNYECDDDFDVETVYRQASEHVCTD